MIKDADASTEGRLHYRECPCVSYAGDPCECEIIAESKALQPAPSGALTDKDFTRLGRLQMDMCNRCGVLVGDRTIHRSWHNGPWGLK